MRKLIFFNVLTWLQINNLLYRDIDINHEILLSIPDEYIPKDISSRVVVLKKNSSERKGYGMYLMENNNENNLHHAIEVASINKLGILSEYIYTNVNNSRQNLYLKLISAMHNLFDNNATEDYNDNPRPVIKYNLYGDGKLLNDWNNPDFFPIAFLALLFYRDADHIAPQSIKVSLYEWAK